MRRSRSRGINYVVVQRDEALPSVQKQGITHTLIVKRPNGSKMWLAFVFETGRVDLVVSA